MRIAKAPSPDTGAHAPTPRPQGESASPG